MRLSAAIKALLAISLWGASFAATKIVLREVSPLAVVVLRFGIAIPVLAIVTATRRQFKLPGRNDLGWLIVLGLNGITVHQLLQANGLMTTTATNSGWIISLNPVFSALMAWLILRESFSKLKVMGLAIALLGAFLVISRGQLSGGLWKIPATPGDFLMLLGSPNWALFTVLSKRLMGRGTWAMSPAMTLTYVMTLGWLAVLPLFIASGNWAAIPHMTIAGWGGVLFLGILCSGAAYIFWYDALQVTGASQLAAFHYLQPFVTVIVAASLLSEKMAGITLLGGVIILFGVWLVNRPSTRPLPSPPLTGERKRTHLGEA